MTTRNAWRQARPASPRDEQGPQSTRTDPRHGADQPSIKTGTSLRTRAEQLDWTTFGVATRLHPALNRLAQARRLASDLPPRLHQAVRRQTQVTDSSHTSLTLPATFLIRNDLSVLYQIRGKSMWRQAWFGQYQGHLLLLLLRNGQARLMAWPVTAGTADVQAMMATWHGLPEERTCAHLLNVLIGLPAPAEAPRFRIGMDPTGPNGRPT